jgi:hypothetical protein
MAEESGGRDQATTARKPTTENAAARVWSFRPGACCSAARLSSYQAEISPVLSVAASVDKRMRESDPGLSAPEADKLLASWRFTPSPLSRFVGDSPRRKTPSSLRGGSWSLSGPHKEMMASNSGVAFDSGKREHSEMSVAVGSRSHLGRKKQSNEDCCCGNNNLMSWPVAREVMQSKASRSSSSPPARKTTSAGLTG